MPGDPEEEPRIEEAPEPQAENEEVNLSDEPQRKDPSDSEKLLLEMKKMQSRNEYLNRQLQKALSEKASQPEPEPAQDEGNDDEYDSLAQKDWKAAVRKLADEEAKRILEEERKKLTEQQKIAQTNQTLEQSKQFVRDRYPDLDDDSSEISQAYMQILNNNPDLLTNPHGPKLAMYEMEELYRREGRTPPAYREQIKDEAQQEVERRLRTTAANTPQGRKSGDDAVVIPKREIEAAKAAGIPIKEYAKHYKLSQKDFREGVSVDE